jgi:hypothetical protein
MTTSVTIMNNGPHRIIVNEVESIWSDEKKEATIKNHSLGVGAEVKLDVVARRYYLCIIEATDVDAPLPASE